MTDWKAEHDHELALRREWSERAQKAEAEVERLRAALLEPALTKLYTMARGNWVKRTFDNDWGDAPHDYEERYIGWFMAKHALEQRTPDVQERKEHCFGAFAKPPKKD